MAGRAGLLGQPQLAPVRRGHRAADGAPTASGKALVFATSAYAGYSSCRQYYEDIARSSGRRRPRARQAAALRRPPGVRRAAMADHTRQALERLGHDDARLVFTAHSIPVSMAETAGPPGGALRGPAAPHRGLVSRALGRTGPWDLVWQSRSGPPQVPWLEPDVCDHLRGRSTRTGRGAGADRVRLRPHGGRLRPRHGGHGRWPTSSGCRWSGRRPPAPTRAFVRDGARADGRARARPLPADLLPTAQAASGIGLRRRRGRTPRRCPSPC